MRTAVVAVGFAALLAGCVTAIDSELDNILRDPRLGDAGALYSMKPYDLLPLDGNLTAHVVDVGQGDGIVVHFPDGVVVIDTGPWTGAEERAVHDHLKAEGVRTIRALVVTHPDADHSGGCDDVLLAFEVQAVIHPGLPKDTDTWNECQAAARYEDALVVTDAELDPGHHLNVSRHATVRVLHVDARDRSEPNEGSLVLRVDYGNVSFLFPADVSCATEDEILARGLDVDVDVLKVGHHGSRHSTCDPWLTATTPAVGIISVGENTYGHPAPETLERLSAHGVDVWRTDRDGGIVVDTDGATWDVRIT